MKSKKIVFTKPNTAEFLCEDIKPLGQNDVLVKLAVSTISSGTEKANLIGEVNTSVYSNRTEAKFPRRVGYSSAGTVEEVFNRLANEKGFPVIQLDWRDLK